MKIKAVLTTLCIALVAVCSGSAALADQMPVFNASVLQEGGNSVSGSSAVSTSFSYAIRLSFPAGDTGTLSGDEFAVAGPGGVGSSSTVSLFLSGGSAVGSASGPAQSSASATFSDFIISGPSGAAAVPGSANFSLNGTFETTATISDSIGNTAHLGGAIIDVGVSGSMPGINFSGAFNQASGANGQGPTGFTSTGNGVFTGDSAPSGFTTAPTLLPVGSPFQVSMTLGTDAFAFYGGNNTGVEGEQGTEDVRAVSNFANTFSFATSGPAFNLPAGYTINSVSADIVNNQFVGGGPAPTPEPSTLLLLFAGMTLLPLLIRHRLC